VQGNQVFEGPTDTKVLYTRSGNQLFEGPNLARCLYNSKGNMLFLGVNQNIPVLNWHSKKQTLATLSTIDFAQLVWILQTKTKRR